MVRSWAQRRPRSALGPGDLSRVLDARGKASRGPTSGKEGGHREEFQSFPARTTSRRKRSVPAPRSLRQWLRDAPSNGGSRGTRRVSAIGDAIPRANTRASRLHSQGVACLPASPPTAKAPRSHLVFTPKRLHTRQTRVASMADEVEEKPEVGCVGGAEGGPSRDRE